MVQHQQEEHARPDAHKRRDKGPLAHVLRLLHGGDDEAPHGCRHHDAGSEARQRPLQGPAHLPFHKENKAGTDTGAEKRQQYHKNYLRFHARFSFLFFDIIIIMHYTILR